MTTKTFHGKHDVFQAVCNHSDRHLLRDGLLATVADDFTSTGTPPTAAALRPCTRFADPTHVGRVGRFDLESVQKSLPGRAKCRPCRHHRGMQKQGNKMNFPEAVLPPANLHAH